MRNTAIALFFLSAITFGCEKQKFRNDFEEVIGAYYGTIVEYKSWVGETYDNQGNYLGDSLFQTKEEGPDTIVVSGNLEERTITIWQSTFEWEDDHEYTESEGFPGYYSSDKTFRFDPEAGILEIKYLHWFYTTQGGSRSNYSFFGEKR